MRIRSIVEASHRMGNWLRQGDKRKSSFRPDKSRKIFEFSKILGSEERKIEENDLGTISLGRGVEKAPAILEMDRLRREELDRKIREEYRNLYGEEL